MENSLLPHDFIVWQSVQSLSYAYPRDAIAQEQGKNRVSIKVLIILFRIFYYILTHADKTAAVIAAMAAITEAIMVSIFFI